MGASVYYPASDIQDSQILAYEICGRDRIVAMSPGWANGNTRHPALGRSLWDLLGNGNIADIYRALVTETRRTGMGQCFTFRCDDFNTRRVMSMAMVPVGDGGIRFSSRPIAEERQDSAAFIRRHRAMPLSVDICPKCGGIKVEDQWLAAGSALESLGIFADDLPFRTWPAHCPSCGPNGH
ncbi:protein of unknown function [Magnetospirillum sp. XM-1]|uniref:hypothetical protein n=1 Tax=Magnetospirillum sp. XM-1 TaxID=1663591 RepID=UPI00073DC00B|nr:hypothetical protein [Magnetospirillum sp. XM-1]CUW40420.1 protein of unknown function [Magnetospirillum sp. XM-1]